MVRSPWRVAVLAAGAVALVGAGCSSAVPRRHAGAAGGVQGGSWDLVMAGPALASAGEGPEYTRRDAALQWEAPESSLSRDLAPPDRRPTLWRARRLYQPQSPFGYIYYAEPHGWPR